MTQAAKNTSGDITDIIAARIQKKVKMFALGNTHRGLREFAMDVINNSNEQPEDIAAECFLCKQTVVNLSEGKTLKPHTETLERIFRHFGIRLEGSFEQMKPAYRNKPKA